VLVSQTIGEAKYVYYIKRPTLNPQQHIETGRESGVIDHIYYDSITHTRVLEGGVIYNAFNAPHIQKDMSRYQSEWKQYGKPLSDHRPVWSVLELTTAP